MTPVTASPAHRPADLYGRSLRGRGGTLVVREEDGSGTVLPVGTYLGPLDGADHDLLTRVRGPVLDVGCGPGRHVLALADRGVAALGVDASPVAVAVARDRGAPVLEGSVFGPIPHQGRWRSALLLDGNIGIGGNPERLLARLRGLLAPAGEIFAELEGPGTPLRDGRIRLEGGTDVSEWFPWARLGTDAIDGVAVRAGLGVLEIWEVRTRWFARLVAR